MAARLSSSTEEAALSLTMAIVASSPGPLLLLDGDLNIVAASTSFSRAFEVDAESATGQPLSSLGAGEWAMPKLRSLLDATISGAANIEAYEVDLERPGYDARRLVVHAQRLIYLDLENRRLLMAVSDVTEARADQRIKDDALRQNLVLLQEVRHRVANSLQIIASVLLQNARKAQSEETRGHLHDAHHRVMSIAALERQLAGSDDGEVDVGVYVRKLCDSIAASMIRDTEQLSLSVAGPGGLVDARTSVSLGLIVTELVINALKHAFPEGRSGRIVVDCDFRHASWSLSVSDDGVGMPQDPALMQTGLGTSIVEALAKQLLATVEIRPEDPGTRVVIAHAPLTLVKSDAERDGQTPAAKRAAA